MTAAPHYWNLFCTAFLRTTPQLSKRLWAAYMEARPYSAHAVRWQAELCSECPTIERQAAFAALVQPKALLEVAERLCAGKRRRKELIELEERILHYTSATGGWRA